MAKNSNTGLKSLQVLRQRKRTRQAERKLKQKKVEMALKSELMHRLEVQFSTVDKVEIEVREEVLPIFLLVLQDPAIVSIYNYQQVDACLFVFQPKDFL